jgi:DNA-binding IscR family transcriptional regulator
MEVVASVEGPAFGTTCLFGLAICSEDKPCPFHGLWGEIRDRILEVLSQRSVADLAAGRVALPRTRKRG